jgi:hypothetical protein
MNTRVRTTLERAERAALAAMGLGLALMLLPHPIAFRAGFFVVLGATVAHIALSHLSPGEP